MVGGGVRPLFYCPGLKGSTSLHFPVLPGRAAVPWQRQRELVVVVLVASLVSLVGVTRVSGLAALAAAGGG